MAFRIRLDGARFWFGNVSAPDSVDSRWYRARSRSPPEEEWSLRKGDKELWIGRNEQKSRIVVRDRPYTGVAKQSYARVGVTVLGAF